MLQENRCRDKSQIKFGGLLEAWRYQGTAKRGGQFDYSDTAIQCLLTLRAVYRLTPRATEGFARSLFELMRLDLPVPDYTTLCRRAGTLPIDLPRHAERAAPPGPRQHRAEGLRRGRVEGPPARLFQAADLAEAPPGDRPGDARDPGGGGQRAGVTDAEAVPSLLEQVENPIQGVGADGAFDRRGVYEELERRGAVAVIPPRRNAKIQRHGKESGPRLARDENLRRSGRSVVLRGSESRGITGVRWPRRRCSRSRRSSGAACDLGPEQQAKEVGIRCRALNIMTHQGMPVTQRVVA